jgi:disulfide bond formation protein DsbB
MAAYHVALQYQPTLELIPCDSGVPCSGRYVAVFGFVSIPVMSGAAFMMISALLLLVRQLEGGADGHESEETD